jgi:SAM-dependent methyltransferase
MYRWIVALALMPYVLYQARKPSKWVGRFFAGAMNRGHSSMTGWGLSHVAILKNFTILDVGCGGGRTVGKLAAIATDGVVHGIDYAEGSVAASRAQNSQLIKAGRVVIQKAPFPSCRSLRISSTWLWLSKRNTIGQICPGTCGRFFEC